MKHVFHMRVVSFCALALLLAFGGTTYAYYSPSVTHGDTLYGVKRGVESVQLVFANRPLERVDAHTHFANRRLAEAKVLAAAQGISEDELLSLLGGASVYAAEEDTQTSTSTENDSSDDTTTTSTSEGTVVLSDTTVSTTEDVATSTDDGVSTSTEEVAEESKDPLAETVEDMGEHMDEAGIAVQEMTDLEDIKQSLTVISTAQETQLVELEGIAETVGAGVSDVAMEEIVLAFVDIEDTQVRIAAAREDVEELLERGETEGQVIVITGMEKGGGVLPEFTATASTTPDGELSENEDEASEEEEEEAVLSRADELREDVSLYIAGLVEEGANEQEVQKLSGKLEKKAAQIEKAIAKGNYNQAAGLEKAFRAMKNNGKHFVKKGNGKKKRQPAMVPAEEPVTTEAASVDPAPAPVASSPAVAAPAVKKGNGQGATPKRKPKGKNKKHAPQQASIVEDPPAPAPEPAPAEEEPVVEGDAASAPAPQEDPAPQPLPPTEPEAADVQSAEPDVAAPGRGPKKAHGNNKPKGKPVAAPAPEVEEPAPAAPPVEPQEAPAPAEDPAPTAPAPEETVTTPPATTGPGNSNKGGGNGKKKGKKK